MLKTKWGVVKMLNSIIEKREQVSRGVYELELQTTEKEFFAAYDDVDKTVAFDLIKKYLIFKQDDARPKDIEINYDKENKIITITTTLRYLKNEFINPK